jgi:YgiT-type zinc finger domain-containing protein
MFRCHVCSGTKARKQLVAEIFQIQGRRVLVENIPALVCERCGEATFGSETTEKIRKMLHSETKPRKSVRMDVFEFTA